MHYRYYVGIDVSKETLDLAVLSSTGVEELKISNCPKAVSKQLKSLVKAKAIVLEETLFCMEPTGHYSNLPVTALLSLNLAVWVANPLDIKNSIGLQRGKSDRIDARRIAEYAMRFKDKARLVQPSEIEAQEIKQLLTQRERLVADRAKYIGQIGDFKGMLSKRIYGLINKANLQIIEAYDKAIKELEKQMDALINAIPELKQQYELLQSITGIGKVLAQTLIAYTNGFERFENPRALACHAGVAPFQYTSGTSVRSRNRVSHRANKRLKCLLHLAALSSIRLKGEIREYYLRKVAEGKSKMSVLNAVRNKIIYRVFAVMKRKTPFIPLELS